MHLTPVPALSDNYIWLLNNDEGRCLIVDPGEAAPVLDYLAKTRWQPEAILLTHHHHDHVGGVPAIMMHYPTMKVYGPAETAHQGTTQIVSAGEKVVVAGHEFTVIDTPGHTSGHISWFSFPYLFCGDTMFSGGCGRLFEGTPAQMYQSFQKINQLPADTLICCAHEYTLSNMQFAHAIWPENREIIDNYNNIKALREKNLISLPTKLAHERLINVFLMTQHSELQSRLNLHPGTITPEQVFAVLRQKKDQF